MSRFMDKIRLVLVLVLLLFLVQAVPVLAAPSVTVTVNATPAYLSLTIAPDTWDVNGITGSGVVGTNTTYYSNPLGDILVPSDPTVDGECRFTITNASTVATNITVNFADFVGGDAITNGDTGSNGAATFGAYSWNSGDTTYATNRTIAKTAGSDYMHSNLAATTNIKFGLTLQTQTNAWTSGVLMQAVVTVTLTQAY